MGIWVGCGVSRPAGLGFVVGVIQFLGGFGFDLILCGFLGLGLTVVWWLPHCGWVCAVVCLVGLLGLFAWFIVVVILGWGDGDCVGGMCLI